MYEDGIIKEEKDVHVTYEDGSTKCGKLESMIQIKQEATQ